MTLLAFIRGARTRAPSPQGVELVATSPPRPASISVVVPVRDNQPGIDRLVAWWCALHRDDRPRELIVVDDGSERAIRIDTVGITLIRQSPSGPARARNTGWRAARGEWIAFVDSDCVPDAGWPAAFADRWNGEIAVQGRVRAVGSDVLSRYYDRQQVLSPMSWTDDGRPGYLITANALVLREALERVGGFREVFKLAAGEDVDLGMRLRAIGALGSSGAATVAHDFEPSLSAFIRRFVRYGRGNRTLANVVGRELADAFVPTPFLPRSRRPDDFVLALTAFVALLAGWMLEGRCDPATRAVQQAAVGD